MKKTKEKSNIVRGQDPIPTHAIKAPVETNVTKPTNVTKLTNTTNVGFVENVTKTTNVTNVTNVTKPTTAAVTKMPSTLGMRVGVEAKKKECRSFVFLVDVLFVVLEGNRTAIVGRATIAGILGKN
jgi:hypothetical protein